MNTAARFQQVARSMARLLAQPLPAPPSASQAPQDVRDAGTAACVDGRRARGGSFIGPWREKPRLQQLSPAQRAQNRADILADLEKTKEASKTGVPIEEFYPDHEQYELIPSDEQDLPERCLRREVGLPPSESLHWTIASER